MARAQPSRPWDAVQPKQPPIGGSGSQWNGSPTPHPDPHRARRRGNRGHSRPILGRGASGGVRQSSLTKPGTSGDWPEYQASHLICPSRQSHLGWQPSRLLADRAEAERAFQLAEQLGSVNAAATQLDTTWPSLRKASSARTSACLTRCRSAAGGRRSSPAQRPAHRTTIGSDVLGAQPGALPARARHRLSCTNGSPRGAVRELGRQRGGRALQRKPCSPANHRTWAIIRRADRAHRLAGQRASRPNRRHADRTSQPHKAQERASAATPGPGVVPFRVPAPVMNKDRERHRH
jgi:hypothetical protein